MPQSTDVLRPLWAMHGFRRTTSEAILDAHQFGVIADHTVDLTIGSHRGFWTDYTPPRLVTNDASEAVPADHHVDVESAQLPYAAKTFGTAVFDPPYRMSGRASKTGGVAASNDRFGVDRYRPKREIWSIYAGGIGEAIRLARDFVIIKCQDQTSSGTFQSQSHHVHDVALDLGAQLEFVLYVVGVPTSQPAGRGIKRPQSNVSQLMVFKV